MSYYISDSDEAEECPPPTTNRLTPVHQPRTVNRPTPVRAQRAPSSTKTNDAAAINATLHLSDSDSDSDAGFFRLARPSLGHAANSASLDSNSDDDGNDKNN
ncbi:hypothetical protein GGI21_004320, partial [Coemansia aciculifera]